MKAWILEINENPSLVIEVKRNMPNGEVQKEISASDCFIKTEVLTSAIKLMTKKSRKTRHQIEQVGCFKRILPVDDNCYAGF